jgi:hypothetical protein
MVSEKRKFKIEQTKKMFQWETKMGKPCDHACQMLHIKIHTLAPTTNRKKGFHSPSLVSKLFGPWLKGALVLVQLKMWAREH